MKEQELREKAKCVKCGKGIGHTGLPFFWTVKINRYAMDMKALQRQQGLAMMMGGHGLLANIMGPNEDMAKSISEKEITLCETCSTDQIVIAAFAEDE
jgi:hypothetical protein